MKLTDLNMDCLETNCEYLGLSDLLNLADTSQRLRKAAELVYIRKYQHKLIYIFGIQKQLLERKRTIRIQKEYIMITSLKPLLQLLRCFGRVIPAITLNINCNRRIKGRILSCIQEYCSESLTKIIFVTFYCGELNEITKPFTNISTVEIWDPIIPRDASGLEHDWIKRLFPKLKKFVYRHQNFCLYRTDCAYLAHHFPHLEHFEYDTDHLFIHTHIENIASMFLLNPQLKTFVMRRKATKICRPPLNAIFFKSVQDHLQNLEVLKIATHSTFFDNFNNDVLSFANVKDFDIDMTYAEHRNVVQMVALPFVFEKLESFSIAYPNDLMNEHFYNFIETHPSINKLHLRNTLYEEWRLENVFISRLEKLLPALVEVEIQRKLTEDQVISVLRKFKSLKILTFNSIDGSTEPLQNRLDVEWSLIEAGQNLKQIKIERRV